MDYILAGQRLPKDGKHRWAAFALHSSRSISWVETRLSEAGCLSSLITRLSSGIQSRDGQLYPVWVAAIEPQVDNLTPEDLMRALATNAVLVSGSPVDGALELALDAGEVLLGKESHPVRFAQLSDKLKAGQFYMARGFWTGGSPGRDVVRQRLEAIGIEVTFPPDERNRGPKTEAADTWFALSTGSLTPLVSDIKTAIGADNLLINLYAFSESGFLAMKWADGSMIDVLNKLRGVGDSIDGAVNSATELAKTAADVVATGTSIVEKVLWFAIPAGLLYLGWRIYRSQKGRRGGLAKREEA